MSLEHKQPLILKGVLCSKHIKVTKMNILIIEDSGLQGRDNCVVGWVVPKFQINVVPPKLRKSLSQRQSETFQTHVSSSKPLWELQFRVLEHSSLSRSLFFLPSWRQFGKTFDKLWLWIFPSRKIALRYVLLRSVRLWHFFFFSFLVDAPAIVNQGLVNIYFTQVYYYFFFLWEPCCVA
jgi:hypothetical protein